MNFVPLSFPFVTRIWNLQYWVFVMLFIYATSHLYMVHISPNKQNTKIMQDFHNPKRFLTLAQHCTSYCFFGSAKAQLSTHNAGRSQIPQVITHRSPFSLPQELHTSLTEPGTGLQTDHLLSHISTDTQDHINIMK